MNRPIVLSSAALLSASVLFASVAQAMEIRQFDKMTVDDRSEYVAELVLGAENILNNEDRSDLAEQIKRLFTEVPAGDEHALGMTEFANNLALARLADAERAAQDPTAHRLHVEDAMLVTLKKNNIPLSRDFVGRFRALNADFVPRFPLTKD